MKKHSKYFLIKINFLILIKIKYPLTYQIVQSNSFKNVFILHIFNYINIVSIGLFKGEFGFGTSIGIKRSNTTTMNFLNTTTKSTGVCISIFKVALVSLFLLSSKVFFAQAHVVSTSDSSRVSNSPATAMPVNAKVNDLILVSIWWKNHQNGISVPAGYTLVQSNATANAEISMLTFYKIATSNDTQLSFLAFNNVFPNSRQWSASTTIVRCADLSMPIAAANNNAQSNSIAADVLGVNTQGYNTLVLNYVATDASNTFSHSSNLTQHYTQNIPNGGSARSGLMASYYQGNPGITPTVTMGLNSNANIVSQTIAINDGLSLLPAAYKEISATAYNNYVEVNWITLSENNNNHFEVQKSTNGKDWRTIEIVEGALNSYEAIQYKSVDYNIESQMNYYRLKQVDLNGEERISEIVYAMVGSANKDFKVYAYPNPSTDFISINGVEENSEVRILNLQGETVLQTNQSKNIPTTSLSAGIYLVQIHSKGKMYQEKIVKN